MNETKTVDLRAIKCVCEKCGNQFIQADFSEFDYGKRVLRTISGKHSALWVAVEDEIYEEFKALIHEVTRISMSPREETRLFNKIFGISCDPVAEELIDASKGYVCQKCGSDDINTFDVIPKQIVPTSLPLISHAVWKEKNKEQKKSAIRLAISEAGI